MEKIRLNPMRSDVLPYVSIALMLLQRYFPLKKEVRLKLEEDHESGEVWLALDATIEGEIDNIIACYYNYTDEWVASVPWPYRHKIRLSFNVL